MKSIDEMGGQEMTETQKIIYITHNLSLCAHVVLQAEQANKGRYCHDINRWLSELKPKLTRLQKVKTENITMEKLTECTKLAQAIGYSLWLLEQGK